MFLQKTMQRNPALIRYAMELHQAGHVAPNTYLIDLDAVLENAKVMLDEANRYGIKLFFMTKQMGRNPLVSRELVRLGYEGAVAVDFKEAITLWDNGVPISHVGHLVQVPSGQVERIVEMRPEYITVYSIEKAKEIDAACRKSGVRQKLLLRVADDGDIFYPGQYGGFLLQELESVGTELLKLQNVVISGITSFPCFLYHPEEGGLMPTPNVETLRRSVQLLKSRFGLTELELNMPSVTCTDSIKKIFENGGTQGEPGHGLLGSTPMHAIEDLIERPSMIYLSEISHNMHDSSYCYGGGYYPRSQINQALVGKSLSEENWRLADIESPEPESIDYNIGLKGNYTIGDSVVMAFRTQVFVTRSEVAVVRGLSAGTPELLSIYNSQGDLLRSYG